MTPAVLVVDDEADFLATYDRLLRRQGYRTITASTGRRRWPRSKPNRSASSSRTFASRTATVSTWSAPRAPVGSRRR